MRIGTGVDGRGRYTHSFLMGVEVEVEGAWDRWVSVLDCFLSLFSRYRWIGREACMCSCGMGCVGID